MMLLHSYWASLSSSASLTGNLNVWVIDRDQARVGMGLTDAVKNARMAGPGSLGWQIIDKENAGDDDAVMEAVVKEITWMAIIGM